MRLDTMFAAATGSVVMDRDRTLTVTADTLLALAAADQPVVAMLRALVTSPDPVGAHRDLQAEIEARLSRGNTAEVLRTLARALAFDPVQDAPRLRAALQIVAERHAAEPLTGPLTSGARPAMAPRVLTSTESATTGSDRVLFLYVNGIATASENADLTARVFLRRAIEGARIPDRYRYVADGTPTALMRKLTTAWSGFFCASTSRRTSTEAVSSPRRSGGRPACNSPPLRSVRFRMFWRPPRRCSMGRSSVALRRLPSPTRSR